MTRNLIETEGISYEWIDIIAPERSELQEIAKKYGLHEKSVNDCLQPDHLPKFEEISDINFIILRIYQPNAAADAETIQQITNKIAIFVSARFIITIHRQEWTEIQRINEELVAEGILKNPSHVLIEIVKAGLHSYDDPGTKLTETFEYYEKQVFLTTRKASMLKGLYFIKRKVDMIKKILFLSYEIIDKMDSPENTNAYSRDIRDLYVKQKSLFDLLSENTNHLLNIYFNISAQRTNETMRVLTIFSVFFMPLTFIVGIYGMNFEHMPELKWKWGYPGVMLLMVAVVVIVYVWFKKKKWL